MGISKLRIKQLLGKMSLSRAVLATIALVVLVQGEGSKDDFSPEMMFTQQGFSYEETAADVYGDYDASLKGQDGLAKKLASAHEEEQTARRKDDGLDGEFVLSSVGIQGGAKAPEDPTSDDFGEMSLVQTMPDDNLWTPSDQPGLADDIDKANEEAKKKKLKEDGLKGNDVLASAGMADEETMKPEDDPTDIGDLFVQLPTKQWKASGQKDMQKSAKQSVEQEEKDDIERSSDDYEEEKAPPQESAQESIFGAVNIKIVKKEDEQDDELKKLGIIDTKDIKFNGPKGWLSEDDIKLLQIEH